MHWIFAFEENNIAHADGRSNKYKYNIAFDKKLLYNIIWKIEFYKFIKKNYGK